jgi:hypothetical protein
VAFAPRFCYRRRLLQCALYPFILKGGGRFVSGSGSEPNETFGQTFTGCTTFRCCFSQTTSLITSGASASIFSSANCLYTSSTLSASRLLTTSEKVTFRSFFILSVTTFGDSEEEDELEDEDDDDYEVEELDDEEDFELELELLELDESEEELSSEAETSEVSSSTACMTFFASAIFTSA